MKYSISFTIECEFNELVEKVFHLLNIEKKSKWTTFHERTEMSKVDNISRMKRVYHILKKYII